MSASWTLLSGQGETKDLYSLNLENRGKKIENTILLEISEYDYATLQEKTGVKVDIKARSLIINGDTIEPEEITTRGQSTLQFKRKSLGFRLKSPVKFRHGEKITSLKKFSVLNLAMDKYYTHNRLAFEMMEQTGLFNLFYSFCELRINGHSEGIFMIIERPEDWALIAKDSHLVLRRGYNHRIEKIKHDSKTGRTETKEYVGYYKNIYNALEHYEGEELYKELSQWIDIEFYMKWLAFNFLVRNGDYSDEVFFYIDPEINKYRIIPWDYDDIFATVPHEGYSERKKMIGDKMLFSSEDKLDTKIATDPYLYNMYLSSLQKVIEGLSPSVLKDIFENAYSELYPYYSSDEIIANSQFDLYKDATDENLKSYLIAIYLGLNGSREVYMKGLKNPVTGH
jgi:spore coat protein H